MSKAFVIRNLHAFMFLFGFLIFFGIFNSVIDWPLQGIHSTRQADTLFSAYSYCYEGTEFLKPKIAHRDDTTGVSIGEFPLFSYLLSIPCKVTGSWSDPLLKYISLFTALLCTGMWGLFLKRKYFPKDENVLPLWAGVFFFMITHLTHLTIPIPDAFASLLIAFAGLIDKPVWHRRLASYFIFAIAFLIRPYFFLLAFLIYENIFVAVGALAVCVGPYLFWYKHWVKQSEIDYYATELKSRLDLLKELPRALLNIPNVFFRGHLNFVFIVPFILGALKQKKWVLFTILGWIVVILLKGDHYVNHNYYLGSASLFAAVITLAGLNRMKKWQQLLILGSSILIGITNTQHLWTDTKDNHFFSIQKEIQKNFVPADVKIVAYEFAPSLLYWARRPGWLLTADKLANSICPSSTVKFKLYFVDHHPKVEPCP